MPSTARSTRSGPARRLRALLVVPLLLAAATTAAAASADSTQPLSPQMVRYWTAIGSCETGAGGPPKWDWGSKHRPGEGALFQGGLGIATTMWQLWAGQLGLLRLYPHAYDAPPLVQMRVAQYGVAHGARWGCSP